MGIARHDPGLLARRQVSGCRSEFTGIPPRSRSGVRSTDTGPGIAVIRGALSEGCMETLNNLDPRVSAVEYGNQFRNSDFVRDSTRVVDFRFGPTPQRPGSSSRWLRGPSHPRPGSHLDGRRDSLLAAARGGACPFAGMRPQTCRTSGPPHGAPRPGSLVARVLATSEARTRGQAAHRGSASARIDRTARPGTQDVLMASRPH